MSQYASSYSRFDLPGLNKPLNWVPLHPDQSQIRGTLAGGNGRQSLFPTALDSRAIYDGYCSLPLLPLREISILQIMNAITDKDGWDKKVFDEDIVKKWKTEATSAPGADVTEKMIKFAIDELRYKVRLFKTTGAIITYNGDVVKSDIAIPADLKASLRKAVEKLEDIPQIYKDYHPGSDGKVLDLVHPSLFPLVYGRSRTLKDRLLGLDECIESIGEGEVLEIRPEEEGKLSGESSGYHYYRRTSHSPYSFNFQWLPCEVDISGESPRVTSYINNLHPKEHVELYTIIEKIIAKTIPLWNLTLSGIEAKYDHIKRVPVEELSFDPDPEDMERPEQHDNETDDDYWERIETWEENTRRTVLPDATEFDSYNDGLPDEVIEGSHPKFAIDLVRDYAKVGLQVIVKLANIELTPEKPEYSGGTWHVEGQLNEHICATALYYYDNHNITDSHLAFRQQGSTDDVNELNYPQNVHGWVQDIYGCEGDGSSVQNVGTILCKEDRLLTFPNILQHQVQAFRLADPSKPGHRKIVALFLVDPGMKIISTANVPPQQRHWWSDVVDNVFRGKEKAIGKLSNELKDKVYDSVDDFPIGMEEAKEFRLKLMDERRAIVDDSTQGFEGSTFSLCEH